MEFRETLLAAQRNQQQKSSESYYYKARFDPPKKEQKAKDKLSANIQKFLAKKDEEEKQKKIEQQRKRQELFAMRDTKALKKIQKTLKVIKSANKSVLADAIDRDHTAVTREGPEQPDQDDYGYESQEAAALYEKMMQKYSKLPDEPKFPVSSITVNKDLNGTRERVRNALLHEDDPVPHKRRRKGENTDREVSPPSKYEPEKERKKEDKIEKPKFRKPAPPPMDFNQLLKLAEQKKSEPVDVAAKKVISEPEPERLMTKKQKREFEEEMARRQRRQERMDAEKSGNRKVHSDSRGERPQLVEKERKDVKSDGGFTRIPKLSDRNSNNRNDAPKVYEREREKPVSEREKLVSEREKLVSEREKIEKLQREKERARNEREKVEREKERIDRERLEKLKAERDRIDREMDRLNKDRDKLDKTKAKLEGRPSEKGARPSVVDRAKMSSKEYITKQDVKASIDLKAQNTYRIDKNSNEKRTVSGKMGDSRLMNGSHGKPVPKLSKEQLLGQKNGVKDRVIPKMSSEGSQKLNGHAKLDTAKRFPENGKTVPTKRPDDRRPGSGKPQAGPSKPSVSNSFDFDKHVNSLSKNSSKQFPSRDVKRKAAHLEDMRKKKRRALDSDSEYDSEMDDFIDDGDENMDYSTHIKEIFGYDRSKYRDMDDDDDPMMESSFARQQREEYISKKIGIMEDLEDMRMEAMEKKKSKRRRLSDD